MLWFRPKTHTCKLTGKAFEISRLEADLLRHLDLPLPTIIQEERARRLLAFENAGRMLWRRCSKSGQGMFSVYPPDAPFPVYGNEIWFDESFDPLRFGKEYNPARPFLEQLYELWQVVPRPALMASPELAVQGIHRGIGVTSSFCLINARDCEDCWYSIGVDDCAHCADCIAIFRCQDCYECIDCQNSQRLRWAEHCDSCADSWFISHCENCRYCLFCTNLSGKEYHVFNQPVSAAEFAQTLENYQFTARPFVESAVNTFQSFLSDHPVPHIVARGSDDVSGNYLVDCEHCSDCFECRDCDRLTSCYCLVHASSCVESLGFGFGMEECGQCVSCGLGARRLRNCIDCWNNVEELTYCMSCTESKNLFGCIGLRGREFCVLNTQFSESEFRKISQEIMEDLRAEKVWGMPLPPAFSSFPYEDSLAGIMMPLSAVQASVMGFRDSGDKKEYRPSDYLGDDLPGEQRFRELPQTLAELENLGDDAPVFLCEISGLPFQYHRGEIELYRRLGVAPPGRASAQRHRDRLSRVAPFRIIERTCDRTQRTIATGFPAHWRQPVWNFGDWAALRKE